MYTYGYLKNAILTKLNLSEKEANEQALLDSFPYNINECLTQIASTIKPRFANHFVIAYEGEIPIPEELKTPLERENINEKIEREKRLEIYLKDKTLVGNKVRMPSDFIAFSGKSMVQLEKISNQRKYLPSDYDIYCEPVELHNEVAYVGSDEIIFLKPGKYYIDYDAFWYIFTDETSDDFEVDIPADIIMCLPSYVASQIWKIDDERKAAIFRNEFEILFSRINNSDYRGNKTLISEGGW